MPQHRRNSTGQVEGGELPHLEEITETNEEQNEHTELPSGLACCPPKDLTCLRGSRGVGEHIFDINSTVKVICSSSVCTKSKFMHKECFEAWQVLIFNHLNKSKDGQRKARNWSEKQKTQIIWKEGYSLVVGACGCRCEQGHLKKDLNWVSPKTQNGDQSSGGAHSDSDKQKRRRKKSSKNSKPALTIGLPNLGMSNSTQVIKRSDAQGIPPPRQRTNSVSSTNSGSGSSWGTNSSSSPTCSPPGERSCDHQSQGHQLPPRRSNVLDRSRHDSGGSIFLRRSDYSSFNVLPRTKINSYHIKMEDECSIGNDETRCFILSNYATNKMNRVPCVLCNTQMNIFERYPLIDGTFFLSPRQHTVSCIPVKAEGRNCYLSAVCMGCLEGWTTRLQCRNTNCLKVWDGSQLILGTMYSYDIFAAFPCCADRLKCTSCNQLVIHPEQRFNFFSDYSQTVSCPHCGVQDFHFTKPLEKVFLSKEDYLRLRSNSGNSGGNGLSLSWARITANS